MIRQHRLRQDSWTTAVWVAGSAALLALVAAGLAIGVLWLAIAILAVVLLLPLITRVLQRRAIHPLEPLWPFLVCYAITFALKPLFDREGFVTYDWFTFDDVSAARAVLVAAGALLVIYGGYFSGAYRGVLPALPSIRREPTAARSRAVAIGCALAGLLALVFLAYTRGSWFDVQAAAAAAYRVEIVRSVYGQGYLSVLLALASFAPAIQLHTALRTGRRTDWIVLAVIALCVGFVLTVAYSRQLLLRAAILGLAVLHFRGNVFSRRTIVAAGVVILLAGGFLGVRQFERFDRASTVVLHSFAFLGHTFDSFEFLAVALERFPLRGQLGGQSFVEDVALTYVPRRLFPEKPDVYGVVRVQNLVAPALAEHHVSQSTYPPGFLVEGYVNFGLVGILLLALGYGVALRGALEWFWPRRERLWPLLMYGGFVLDMTSMFRSASQVAITAVVLGALFYVLLQARVPVVPGQTPHHLPPRAGW
jgi:hypothetical protein